jgi:hypothetical protein
MLVPALCDSARVSKFRDEFLRREAVPYVGNREWTASFNPDILA